MTYFERAREIINIANSMTLGQLAEVVTAYGEAALSDIMDDRTNEEINTILKRKSICKGCGLCTNLSSCDSTKSGMVEKDFFYRAGNQQRNKGDMHTGCGCGLTAKQKTMDAQCPLGKWEN